ncbi:MAG: hypothetical protein KBG04_05280 [Bacteroidales bacterium]|nr:hypothetical protein [Bacteroidales bacterium]
MPFNITIAAKDQYGNTYTNFNSPVTLSVNKGTITPTTTASFVNGVLSNFSVSIPNANTGVIIAATGGGKTGTSNQFDVNLPTTFSKFFHTTSPMGTQSFIPTDTIHITWDVEGFIGTEGKVRILFYNGSSWDIIVDNLNLADGSYDLNLTGRTIIDPLRCRVRAGAYNSSTGAWLTWSSGGYSGQYYDEIGHFWILG